MNRTAAIYFYYIMLFFLICFITSPLHTATLSITIQKTEPAFALSNVPFQLRLIARTSAGDIDTSFDQPVTLSGVRVLNNGCELSLADTLQFQHGVLTVQNVLWKRSGTATFEVHTTAGMQPLSMRIIPGYFSLLPPVMAILLALLFKQVLVALFAGVWLGATFIYGYNPVLGFGHTLDTFLIQALADPSHAAIIIFSMTLGGMVGVISKSGGTQGIVQLLSRFANSRRGGQIATWAMGVFIFFDDYANTLIVGNTMRPFTDKLRISREKLSYIVDSTAAPVASIAIISSWVGFQVGLIDQAFKALGLQQDAYVTFVQSVPYASYSVLAVLFVFFVGLTLRDLFSMYHAEHRAYTTGKLLHDDARPLADDKSLDIQAQEGIPLRWYNALLPIFTVIIVTMVGLYFHGYMSLGEKAKTARFGEIIGAANSFDVLMWASFLGALVAIFMAVSQRILTMSRALDAWLSGVKAMVIAMIILILAWSIGNICGELKTADYIIEITRGFLSPHFLPVIGFIISAFIGFSTGTSWATMAILIPIVIPTAHKLCLANGIDPVISQSIMLGTIASVLSGSVFGDHCSPISDTTIMSSMASAADHVDHVRTQLPYAILVALVACMVGYLPAGFGMSPWISLLFGVAILFSIIRLVGKPVFVHPEEK